MNKASFDAIGDFARGPIPGATFRSLNGPDKAVPQPPRFFFGPFLPELAASYFGIGALSSIGVFSLVDFSLTGNFLLSRDENYYRCPELNIHEAHINGELKRLAECRSEQVVRRLSGPHVVLAGPGIGIYGHWLVEYLPKIALLNFANYNIHSLQFLLPKGTPGFVSAFLELLTIKPTQIVYYDPDHEIIRADELIVPTVMHNGVRMSPLFQRAANYLKDLIQQSHDLGTSSHGPRIFLSRAAAGGGRALENRAAVEELAVRANFEIVCPEQLSLVNQVRLFSNATEVMGEYGSALHGTIFSQPGTLVCALRGNGGHPGFLQSGIGVALEQPTGYIFGDAAGPEGNWRFKVDEQTVATALRLIFGGWRV